MRRLGVPLGVLMCGLLACAALLSDHWAPVLERALSDDRPERRVSAAAESRGNAVFSDEGGTDARARASDPESVSSPGGTGSPEAAGQLPASPNSASQPTSAGGSGQVKPGTGEPATAKTPKEATGPKTSKPATETPTPPPPPQPIETVEGQQINPNLDGYLTDVNAARIRGFAFDAAEREAEVWVVLFVDEAEAGEVRCERREEHKQHGVIWHFEVLNPPQLADNEQHRVRAYALRKDKHGRKELRWSPRDVKLNQFPQGRLEAASPESGLSGYAWDPDSAKEPAKVVFKADGVQLFEARADRENEALLKRKIAPVAKCAFATGWPEQLNDGQSHVIQAFALDSQTGALIELEGSPRTVAPLRGFTESPPVGNFDLINKSVMSGWAWDPDVELGALDVEIWIDDEPYTRLSANQRRDALLWAKITPDPYHGFVITTPGKLLDDRTHTVRAFAVDRPSGLLVELDGSPRTYRKEENSAPMGSFWHADEKRLQGWAADPDLGISPCEIEIYIDGKLWQRVKADSRDDGLIGTGLAPNPEHGFRITPPESVKDGLPHEVTIYAVNHPEGPPTNLGTRVIGKNSIFPGFWTQDKLLDTRIDKGLYVSGVSPWFDAYHKGVKQADVLLTYGDQATTTTEAFRAWLNTRKKDQLVKMTFWRDGQTYEVEIKLGQLMGN